MVHSRPVNLTRTALAAALLTLTLTGCAADTTASTDATGKAPAATSADSNVPAEAMPLLARYDLDGKSTVEIIDQLDRLALDERPADLMASVRPSELVLSSGDQELSLEIPEDRFYLSVAPYVDQTHECFNHSLTTCKGQLASRDLRVQVVDDTDKVLVDETRTTFENGFLGLWLPRQIDARLRVTYADQVGEVDFSTDDDAPTCLTTLQLT